MAKEITYKGKTAEEWKNISREEFVNYAPARVRRSLKRGFSDSQKRFLARLAKFKAGLTKKPVKTHCRDMVVIPEMIGSVIHIYRGKEFVPIEINVEMLGHYLGEFAHTRSRVTHSAPGIGATRSSAGIKKAKG
ncbi:MAG TPA: 30S ribosomal protein S19 [Candidatus Nanoarchaeia archaeon]|nr:30S ribosomal protein S19 [Candidatus Nanoarchaeia archaeon]